MPVAVDVSKMNISSQALEEASTKLQEGVIYTLPNSSVMRPDGHNSHLNGTIAYQLKGETFYLPFTSESVSNPRKELHVGDKVQFCIVKNRLTNLCYAKDISVVSRPTLVKGVICTLKETFGFIEREDVVKEVFFHFSEFIGDITQFELGTEVEFEVRNMGRDVACKIRVLPKGTVVFDEIEPTTRLGRVVKTIERGKKLKDPFSGRIVYDDKDAKCVEIPFGDKDIIGTYSLFEEDIVEFKIAVDKRDKMKRATAIKLLEQSFLKSKEIRETGIIVKLEENHGFVKSDKRREPVQFSFSEIMTDRAEISEGDSIVFTTVFDPVPRAVRLAVVSKVDTMDFSAGVVSAKIWTEGDTSYPGCIVYENDGMLKQIPVFPSDLKNITLNLGDMVKFRISVCDGVDERKAVDLSVYNPKYSLGFVTYLHDENKGMVEWFGFKRELMYISSTSNEIQIGDEVEFSLSCKPALPMAYDVRKVEKTKIKIQTVGDLRRGIIIKCCKYGGFPLGDFDYGEIKEQKEDGSFVIFPFSFGSLLNKTVKTCVGDEVMFACGTFLSSESKAFYVALLKDVKKGIIECIKTHFGFITDNGRKRKVFFHSSAAENYSDLHPGDEVEYVLVYSPKVNKLSAILVKKCSTSVKVTESKMKRPKTISISKCGAKQSVMLVREPKNPVEGSRGFNAVRSRRLPGQLLDS